MIGFCGLDWDEACLHSERILGFVGVAGVVVWALAAIVIGGDSLQIDSQIPSAAIYVLTALILMAVLGFTSTRKARA